MKLFVSEKTSICSFLSLYCDVVGLPVASYHITFFGYPVLGLISYDHQVGYPKNGAWYEPTGSGCPEHVPESTQITRILCGPHEGFSSSTNPKIPCSCMVDPWTLGGLPDDHCGGPSIYHKATWSLWASLLEPFVVSGLLVRLGCLQGLGNTRAKLV